MPRARSCVLLFSWTACVGSFAPCTRAEVELPVLRAFEHRGFSAGSRSALRPEDAEELLPRGGYAVSRS
jgi:hypothetical protein